MNSDRIDINRLIKVLRELDAEQQRTESLGGREIAWYYYRDDVEAALNLEPGALDTGEYEEDEENEENEEDGE